MNLKPTMYVDDEGQTYRPDSLPEGKRLYGMYHEKIVQSLAADVQTIRSAGMLVISPDANLWAVLDDIRQNGKEALMNWEVFVGGKWCRILPLANDQINLNGNLEYRRIGDGDGS